MCPKNSLVTVWLLHSMNITIAKPHIFKKTAKEVWDSARATYSDLKNSFFWQSSQFYKDQNEPTEAKKAQTTKITNKERNQAKPGY